MASNTSQIKFRIRGIDEASAVLRRVGATARTVAAGVGVIAAAAAAAVTPLALAMSKMTDIGDIAAKAGTSAENLQRLGAAFSQLGIRGANLESIGAALNKMQKNTGGSGIDGFIAAIDAAKNAANPIAELEKTFGKFGAQLTPLLAGNSDALRELIDLQFAAGNSSIDAATKATNAWGVFSDGFKAAWYDVAGEIAKILDENIEGGVYAAAYKSVAYTTAAVKSIIDAVKFIGAAVRAVVNAVEAPIEFVLNGIVTQCQTVARAVSGIYDAATGGGFDAIKRAWADIKGLQSGFWENLGQMDAVQGMADAWQGIGESIANIKANFAAAGVEAGNAVERASKLDALKKSAAGAFTGIGSIGKTSGAARNELILGGSYAAQSLALKSNTDAARTRAATESAAESLELIAGKLSTVGVI